MRQEVSISKSGDSLSVDILGAQLNSWKVEDIEYIWQRNPNIWGGSAPILFPIIGELKGEGKTTLINGKPYHISIHGFVSGMEFVPVYQRKDEVVLEVKANDDTLKMYPFNFTLGVKYKIIENGFSQTFIVENEGKEDMPFFVGSHPAFNVPMFSGETFEDYVIEFERAETCEAYRIDDNGLVNDSLTEPVFQSGNQIHLTHSIFQKGALLFDSLNSHSVKLYNKRGKGIKMDFPDFNYFGIWQTNTAQADYICLEPWTGMNDCYSEDGVYTHKRGVTNLKSGEEKHYTFTVSII